MSREINVIYSRHCDLWPRVISRKWSLGSRSGSRTFGGRCDVWLMEVAGLLSCYYYGMCPSEGGEPADRRWSWVRFTGETCSPAKPVQPAITVSYWSIRIVTDVKSRVQAEPQLDVCSGQETQDHIIIPVFSGLFPDRKMTPSLINLLIVFTINHLLYK